MSPAQAKTPDCQVLVIGAGPTGLMAADLLKRSGVDVRIVDARAEASRESRAFAVMARSMELFGQMGLADRLLDTGVVNPGIDFFVRGSRTGGLDYDRAEAPDTPYRFITLHPQSRTETVLIDDLAGQGLVVERSTTVHGLAQDDDGVTVRATRQDGQEFEIRCAYAIGTDGAHSVVRKALGLSFEGAKYPQTFMLADCRVTWPADKPLDHARFRVFMHGDTIALFLPLDGERSSRVMVTDHTGKADLAEGGVAPLALDELQAAYRQATDLEVTLTEPTWTTRYRISHRGVPEYGVGRVFVAGDAAHIHSPAGGQGMNTGLQDAANLAWKLAAVLRGAPADLLDSYDAERRAVGREVVATSDAMFTAAAGQTGWEARVRDWIAAPVTAMATQWDGLQTRAFRKLSQLEISYPHSRYFKEAAPKDAGPAVGHRAPNAVIAHNRDVFDLTTGYGFTVLALSRKPLERDAAAAAADAVEALRSGQVAAHLVSRLAVGRDTRIETATAAEVFERYGLEGRDDQAIVVIRPDGYVAWRAAGLDFAGCRRFLEAFATQESPSHG